MRFLRSLSAAAVLLIGSAPDAAAQRTSAQLALGGGSATDARGVSSSAVIIAPGVLVRSANASVRLGLSGTSFTGGGWAGAGGAGVDLRIPTGHLLALTLGGAAATTVTSHHSSYSTLSGSPALELRLAPVTLFGGISAAAGWSSFPLAPAAGPFTGPARRSSTRRSAGPLFGGRLLLASSLRGSVTLGYREEHVRGDSLDAADRSATLSVIHGPLAVTGTLAARTEHAETAPFGGVRAQVGLSRILALQFGAERYPGDRLTGTVGGRSVTLALVLRTPSGPRPLPRPSGVPAAAEGITRLSIRAADAATVEVAGDWNGWHPVAAHRGANGVWYADLMIPAGTYRYAFRMDRREWRVPEGAAATDDGFGGKSAWLTVGQASK